MVRALYLNQGAPRSLGVRTSLSASERNEVIDGINTFLHGTETEKVLNDSIAQGTRIPLGPTDGKCPCCRG